MTRSSQIHAPEDGETDDDEEEEGPGGAGLGQPVELGDERR